AFRNTAPQKLRIAVEAPAGHPEEAITNGRGSGAEDLAARVAAAISNSPGLVGVALPPAEAARQLRTGKVELIVRAVSAPGNGTSTADQAPQGVTERTGLDPNFEYRFDPTRPESRTARLSVDDALQRAFGRHDVAETRDQTVVEPGARYIDFLI